MASKFIRAYAVDADRETGEWIEGTLQQIGFVGAIVATPDTDDVHYDTAEINGETCHIEVRWV